MYKELLSAMEKPPLYEKMKIPFWDDAYISEQMLKAHLDPHFEGASRKLEFIGKSAEWIQEIAPPSAGKRLIDLGCGPGIYAERFSRAGYDVTGVDFSRRSIRYAIQSAEKKRLQIHYLCQDYLRLGGIGPFDLATLIYCDYGVLSTEDRGLLMDTVYGLLKPGGRFLLDVFSTAKYESFEEAQTWELCKDGGFWRSGPYIAISGSYKYPDYTTLEQISVFTEAETSTYYLWNTCFSKETLTREAAAAGFRVCGLFADAAGGAYCEDSPTLAVVLEK